MLHVSIVDIDDVVVVDDDDARPLLCMLQVDAFGLRPCLKVWETLGLGRAMPCISCLLFSSFFLVSSYFLSFSSSWSHFLVSTMGTDAGLR